MIFECGSESFLPSSIGIKFGIFSNSRCETNTVTLSS